MCFLVMSLCSRDINTLNGSTLTGLTCSKAPGFWMVEHQLVKGENCEQEKFDKSLNSAKFSGLQNFNVYSKTSSALPNLNFVFSTLQSHL